MKPKEKEKKEKQAKGGNSIGFFQSIGGKIIALVALAVIISITIVMVISLPAIEKSMKSSVQNYLKAEAQVYGEQLNRMQNANATTLENVDILSQHFSDPDFQNIGAAYIYVVDRDGIMKFHPTAEKIGQPVENAAIKQVVKNMQDGAKMDKVNLVSYKFNGDTKYSSYYIGGSNKFVLVISAS